MSKRVRTTCMFSDEESEWLKSISLNSVSAGVWILYKNRESIDALLDGSLNVRQPDELADTVLSGDYIVSIRKRKVGV